MAKILKTNNSVPTVKEVQNAGVVPAVRELFRLVAQILDNPDGIIDSIKEIKQFLKDIEEPGGTVPSLKALLDNKTDKFLEDDNIQTYVSPRLDNKSISTGIVAKNYSAGSAMISIYGYTETNKGQINITSGNGNNSTISVTNNINLSASGTIGLDTRNGNQIGMYPAAGNNPNYVQINAGGGDIKFSTGGKIEAFNGGDYIIGCNGALNVKNNMLRIDSSANISFSGQSLTYNGLNIFLPIVSVSSSPVNAGVQTYYKLLGTINTFTISLPQGPNNTISFVAVIAFRFTTGNSPSITFTKASGASFNIKYFDNYVIEANTNYEVMAVWNNGEWIISSAVIV